MSGDNGLALKNGGRNSSSKVITKEDTRITRMIKPSPLQVKLEEHLQKKRKANGKNGSFTTLHANGKSQNGSAGHKSPDEQPLVSPSSDSEEELTVVHFSRPPSASSRHSTRDLPDCKQQLLKDGYRLDEISDEEDLDLIPPRNMDDRCQCCGALSMETCVIS